jgi:hypothetical protein
MRQAMLLFLTLILAASFAQGQDVPKRKSGLWEITRTSTRTADKARLIQMCVDEATDNALRQLAEGMPRETCKTDKISRDGDKLVVESTCKLRQSTSRTHAVITGKFDSAYKIESKSTYDPPLAGKAEGHAVLEAKWTGPCKADQRPGDMILPSGLKVHVDDDAQATKDKPDARVMALMHAPARKPGSMPVPSR